MDGVAVALDGRAAVSGRTVTIPLASAVTATQTVTVTYTDAAGDQNTAGVIEDLVRNDAPSFTAKPVENKVGVIDTLSGLEVWEMWTSSVSVRNRMTLSPGFASDTLTYTGTVRGETQYIEIRTGTTDDAATVSITPGDRFTGLDPPPGGARARREPDHDHGHRCGRGEHEGVRADGEPRGPRGSPRWRSPPTPTRPARTTTPTCPATRSR